jgi:hypothetical protein
MICRQISKPGLLVAALTALAAANCSGAASVRPNSNGAVGQPDYARWSNIEFLAGYSFVGDVFEDEDLSAIACVSPTRCLIGADEASKVQVVELSRQGERLKVLADIALLSSAAEIDIEAIAVGGDCYYITGSHGVSKEDGKIMSVSRVGLGLDFEKDFGYLCHTKIWFDFTIPTYEDMSSYRTRCAVYRREVGQMLVDKLQLRNFILVWHLKDWSLTGKDGKIDITHDQDGSLNDASVKKAYSLHPTIIDVVLTIFEKDILLV